MQRIPPGCPNLSSRLGPVRYLYNAVANRLLLTFQFPRFQALLARIRGTYILRTSETASRTASSDGSLPAAARRSISALHSVGPIFRSVMAMSFPIFFFLSERIRLCLRGALTTLRPH